jgi:hypothetical protein
LVINSTNKINRILQEIGHVEKMLTTDETHQINHPKKMEQNFLPTVFDNIAIKTLIILYWIMETSLI